MIDISNLNEITIKPWCNRDPNQDNNCTQDEIKTAKWEGGQGMRKSAVPQERNWNVLVTY